MPAAVQLEWRELAVSILRRCGRLITAARTNRALAERALASATFAGIFAFGMLGIDYLINGGPDWNPGGAQAYAMEIPERRLPQAPVFVPETPSVVPQREGSAPNEIDYSFATEDLLGGPYDVYAAYMADAKRATSEEHSISGESAVATIEASKPGSI